MTIEHIALLEIILDAIALFLGSLAIAGVVMIRRRGEGKNRTKTPGRQTEQFHILLVDFIEQTERTFQKVSDALREERESLQETGRNVSCEKPEPVIGNVTSLSEASRRRKKRGSRRGKRKLRKEEECRTNDRYSEVAQLAQNGMPVREIAEKVALPRSEIELIMELNRQ